MGDVTIFETTQHMDNGIDLANVGEKLIAETLTLDAPRTKPAISTNSNDVGDDLRRLANLRENVKSFVGAPRRVRHLVRMVQNG